MKHSVIFSALSLLLLVGCNDAPEPYVPEENEWSKRKATIQLDSTFETGSTYLSVHSQGYSRNSKGIINLTVTVSMRNSNRANPAYILNADYFDTHGAKIRTYFQDPIVLQPMETVEIIISELDIEGGTGGNFIFDWAVAKDVSHPLFDAVMLSTMGQQGISFTTVGIEIK